MFSQSEDDAYIDVLRTAINGTDRKVCFNLIAAVVEVIAEIGGVHAIEQCVRAVIDVHRWWP